jgi:hypothetical protein
MSWNLREAKETKSVQVSIEFSLTEWWNPEQREWTDWAPYDHRAFASVWIIKRDGTPNERALQNLVESLGWNGDIDDLNRTDTWTPNPCQLTVEENTYDGKTTLRVNWINPYNAQPVIKGMDESGVKQIKARLGGQFRALAANIRRNGPQPIPAKAPSPPPVSHGPVDTTDVNEALAKLHSSGPPLLANLPAGAEDDLPF